MTVHFLVDNIKFPPIPNHEIGKYTGYTSIHANKCIVYLFSKFVIRLSTFFSLHYFVGGSTSCSGNRGRRCRDRMVAGFITTYAISAYHHQRCEFESSSGEVYSIQHYVIKFVINLRQIGGFFRALRFPSAIKLIVTKYC
jgi:hypothetical protein